MRNVDFWSFFYDCEMSEKIHKSTFQVKISVCVEHIFYTNRKNNRVIALDLFQSSYKGKDLSCVPSMLEIYLIYFKEVNSI